MDLSRDEVDWFSWLLVLEGLDKAFFSVFIR